MVGVRLLRGSPVLLGLLLMAVPFSAFAPGHDAPLGTHGPVPDEVVVGFAGAVPADVDAWLGSFGATRILRDDATHWVSAKFPSAAAADRFLARAPAMAGVRFAERDGTAGLALTPDDPRYGEQWGFPAILAEQAWDITLGTHDVRVAVLDTGTRVNHPDLAPNMCGPFVSTVPGSPNPDDDHGHGTHVAGTVAAVTDNGVGVAGTAQACVMGARVLSRGGGQWSWIAAGVTWAADHGADIISMSLQGPFSQVMQDAVRYAYDTKGVLVVSAAGNYGCSAVGGITGEGSVAYPGRYDESMAVASLDDPGLTTSSFSSCGRDMEIAAPGRGVLSTVPGPGYALFSGTSMATPHVSGVAALVKGQHPGISALALRCLLDLSADDAVAYHLGLYLPGRDFYSGWGRLNAPKALLMDQALRQAGAFPAFEQACRDGAAAIMH